MALPTAAKNLNSFINILSEARKNIKKWTTLIAHWNGLCLFYKDLISASHDLTVFTNASLIGFSGFLGSQWFSSKWPPEIQNLSPQQKSTALLELYPIVTAAHLWGHQWTRKSILFYSNKSTVHIINKGHSSPPSPPCYANALTSNLDLGLPQLYNSSLSHSWYPQ